MHYLLIYLLNSINKQFSRKRENNFTLKTFNSQVTNYLALYLKTLK